ncbi:hypothetical protein AJ79_05180 [Helicocarpus griseus UAMH5409]|uniref:Btz domain-containing protein n=1 Tax=Helicocarpus griseus UAMH5409 TaxID=1447875 RepID=A0A2B7XGT4_9EURO|nr:hypothetical protein AJ79_05180 [Helicocarpus griseus UAMH5409]
MAPHQRSRIASRRRREDEGDDDGSMDGDLEDDSLSEGTLSAHEDDDVDDDGSDLSENDRRDIETTNGRVPAAAGGSKANEGLKRRAKSASPTKQLFGTRVSETEAMLNGLNLADGAAAVEEIHFDDMKEDLDNAAVATPKSANDKGQKRETFAEKKRREHEEYIRQRDSNPAFVPTRGGFFLHDKRNTDSPPNGYRPSYNNNNKPKTRPHGLIVDSNAARRPAPKPDVTAGQWAHDLHETVAQDSRPIPSPSAAAPSNAPQPNAPRPVPTAPRSSPPNRSFSSTVLVGNVPVIVFLPGMKAPIPYSAVPKKQHTRLPQHRPPLRRDKPVRISIPGQAPRYIFPATERSFIFIPRALRPNQQYRQRGRGGFYGGGGRRTSVYGGSIYTPSVAMSRRSSLGRGAEIIGSPAASVASRVGAMPGEGGKPVVRLPPSVRPPVGPGFAPHGVPPHMAPPPPYSVPPPPEFRENRPTHIPMHQPRPQKTVSVADIESPVTFQYNPPQQQEQPFHHQVPHPVNGAGFMPDSSMYPPHARHASHASQASATPLPQIPERAIHAQPFQPYPYQPQPYYAEGGYQPGPMFYPASNPEYAAYNPAVPPGQPPAYVAPGQPMPYSVAPSQPPAGDQAQSQSGTVAHESNGTVYYYDTSQFANSSYPQNATYPAPPPGAPQGGVVGMGGMLTPPGTAYYYPQSQPQPQNGTVYYA